MAFCSAVFEGRPEFGAFTDPAGVAAGLEKYSGKLPAVLFAVALIDASIIGAAAVSLSTAYALGDMLSLRHSLHRKPSEAKAFYVVFCGVIAAAAALVLTPGTPLGLLTNAVQTLAGVLLPSATVFLLLLCNDKAVLGPWVNTRFMNMFTAGVVAVLVMLSLILTASVVWPDMGEQAIIAFLIAGAVMAVAAAAAGWTLGEKIDPREASTAMALRELWRMPPLDALAPPKTSRFNRLFMFVLGAYLVVVGGMVLARVVQLAIFGAA
jgi:hypothetical protein